MQSRFWLKTYKENEVQLAYAEKARLLKENPDNIYQIRKGKDGGNTVFRLVERFTKQQTELVNRLHQPDAFKQRKEEAFNSLAVKKARKAKRVRARA